MPTKPSNDDIVKKLLTELIIKGNAHASLEEVVADLPIEDVGNKPGDLPYSIWKLVEHIRITQWDILEFSRNPEHTSPNWPDGYWPSTDAPSNEKEWERSLLQIKKERDEFIRLLSDPAADLYHPFAHGEGQNLFREAILIADHTSYHLGQIIVIRRLLNNWKD
jgi:hypothetical protein